MVTELADLKAVLTADLKADLMAGLLVVHSDYSWESLSVGSMAARWELGMRQRSLSAHSKEAPIV